MLSLIKRYYRNLCRALSYARIGWSNYDWDDGYIYVLILFKLKRMQKAFVTEGYHSEDCENYRPKMKSLELTIKLLEKYNKHNYSRFCDKHYKKWGEAVMVTTKDTLSNYVSISFESPLANTPELKEQERAEFKQAYCADERERVRDLNLIHKIMAKYSHYWWD